MIDSDVGQLEHSPFPFPRQSPSHLRPYSQIFKMSHGTVAEGARSALRLAQAVQGIDRSPSPLPLTNTSHADTALAISSTILNVLEGAAQLSPVPFIQPAAALALAIVQNIQVITDPL